MDEFKKLQIVYDKIEILIDNMLKGNILDIKGRIQKDRFIEIGYFHNTLYDIFIFNREIISHDIKLTICAHASKINEKRLLIKNEFLLKMIEVFISILKTELLLKINYYVNDDAFKGLKQIIIKLEN